MKKVLSGLLVATAVASVAEAAPFEGFYVGAQTGMTSRKTEVKASTKTNTKKSTINYGIFAGYGHKMDSLYVGAELSLAHTPNKAVKDKDGDKYKLERGVAFGLAPRVGFFAAPDILVFAKLGLEAAREKYKDEAASGALQDATKSKTNVSFVPGLGVEKSFGNFIARVAYEHKFGRSVKDKDDSTISYKATEHRFLLGAAWGF